MDPTNRSAYVYKDLFFDSSGMTTGLTIEGSGINLQPEESTNWTVGVDFTPLALQGLELSVTYFNILHEERVSTPFPSGYDFFGVLLDPAYAAVVTRTQDQAALVALIEEYSRVACYTATTIVYPCTAPPLDEVTAIVDRRIRNLAAVRQEGIDFQLHYQLRSPIGEWGFTLSGQHLLKNSERLVNTAPYSEQLNNVWRPVDLRLRSGVSFTRGVVNANAFINYIDSYRDRRDPSSVRAVQRSTVASWATVDLSAQYDLSAQLAPLGLSGSLSLNAVNVFDRDPPFIGSSMGLHFDGVNANPLGRFVGAQVTVRW